MNDAMFSTRLRFEGNHGIAKREWRTVRLDSLPQFLAYRIVAIDYIPAIVAMVMPYGKPWQDMGDHERLLAEQLLKEIV